MQVAYFCIAPDFNLPKRFDITYMGTDGEEHEVVMIHRALLGTIERFFAILIENCRGNLPTWLAPTQAIVLPVSVDCVRYAEQIHRELLAQRMRAAVDYSTSTISYKIRQAEVRKIPYMIICGEKESKLKRISVRKHKTGDIGLLRIAELVQKIKNESI